VVNNLLSFASPIRSKINTLARLSCSIGAIALCTWAAYRFGLNVPTVGFLYLVLVVLVSLHGGFAIATVTSIFAAVCLDYFFIPPVLSFEVNTLDYWIALGTFEFTALVITRLAHVANLRAVEAIAVRRATERLYETARRILLFDRSEEPGSLLVALVQDVFELPDVVLFDAVTAKTYGAGNPAGADERLRGAYGRDRDEFDPAAGTWFCVLRLGARPVGGIALGGTAMAAPVATALASLCATALERARSFEREYRSEAARQSEQLRAAVLDALGHQFKTPVTTIWTASSGLLEVGGLSELQTELLTVIDEQAKLLNDLAARLLGTAKLDSASFEPRRRPLLLSKQVATVIQTLPEQYRDRFRVAVLTDEIPVLADHRLVVIAMTQLLDNAIKYSVPESPIDIRFGVTETEASITVRDQGLVIQPDDRERIFERFYRGSLTDQGPAGTGLGLSIVKRIVEAHHGRVWFESKPEGTEFSICLPAVSKPLDGQMGQELSPTN
jgi:two-component system sensor histidine kinase KdpD